ncbi:MAG: tyrosine/phenylalanine carboxypeptidase domain-containing protein [Polyangiaceae bacterium]
MQTRPPAWTSHADEALASAARGIRLLSAVTPLNAKAERARLIEAVNHNDDAIPKWTYASPAKSDVRERLDQVARALGSLGDDRLVQIYLARAHELAREAELIEAVGTESFAALATARFSGDSRSITKKARALALGWANEKATDDAEVFASDADHPDSLLSVMKKEVGKRGLPFRVQVHAPLSSLAATGDGVIYVTAGRPISKAAAVRTVLHEIEGHALPRIAASKLDLAIFRIGTAGGTDDQEGLALLVEEREASLVGERRRDLASRAMAVEAMRNGADFPAVVKFLRSDHGRSATQSVSIAERIFRGSYGRTPGLGRESIYLESFVRVKAHVAKFPEAERVLKSGQVSVDAADVLASYAAT